MKKTTYFISMVMLSILVLLTIPYAVKMLGIILFPQRIGILRQLSIYLWVGVGILAFAIIHSVVKKNMVWLETFSHELTHIVVAFLFFRNTQFQKLPWQIFIRKICRYGRLCLLPWPAALYPASMQPNLQWLPNASPRKSKADVFFTAQ